MAESDVGTVIDQVIEENARARSELMEALDGLPEDSRRDPWYGDQWSVHDIIAHIAAWEDGCAHALERMSEGQRPEIPGYDGEDLDGYNAEAVEAREDVSWDGLLSELGAARERHEAAVQRLPDTVAPERLERGRTARRLAESSANHDREHIGAIVDWRHEHGI